MRGNIPIMLIEATFYTALCSALFPIYALIVNFGHPGFTQLKYALYLHQKSVNWALSMVFFWYFGSGVAH